MFFIFINISLYVKIKQELLQNNELLLTRIKKLNQEKSTKENQIEDILNMLKKNEIKQEMNRQKEDKKKMFENETIEKVLESKELKNKNKYAYVFYASHTGK